MICRFMSQNREKSKPQEEETVSPTTKRSDIVISETVKRSDISLPDSDTKESSESVRSDRADDKRTTPSVSPTENPLSLEGIRETIYSYLTIKELGFFGQTSTQNRQNTQAYLKLLNPRISLASWNPSFDQ